MLVLVGGVVGTLLRWLVGVSLAGGSGAGAGAGGLGPGALGLGLPGAGATLAVNLVGSFLLGALLGWAGEGRRGWRLLLGTGLLGSFTTYSAFAVLLVDGTGLGYAAVSLLGGAGLAALGLWLGGRRGTRAPAEERARRGPFRRRDAGAGPT